MKTLTSILAVAALSLGLATAADARSGGGHWSGGTFTPNAAGCTGSACGTMHGPNGALGTWTGGTYTAGGRGGAYGGGYGGRGGYGGGYGGGFGGGYGGFGGYGLAGYGAYGAFGGLLPAFGGQVCLDPLSGQPVLCPVLSPFLGGWGYGRGHHHH